jgi:hypothetical protein
MTVKKDAPQAPLTRGSPEWRAAWKQYHPDLDRDRLQRAGRVSIDDHPLELLSGVAANYLWDLDELFEPPKAWSWSRPAPLTREMEKRRRDWLICEVEKIWRACGGTGSGAHVDAMTGKHVGPLLELLEELLNQFNAPLKQRSRHTLYRAIKNRHRSAQRRASGERGRRLAGRAKSC